MLARLTQASRRQASRSWIAAVIPCRHYASRGEGGPEDPFKQGPTYAKWLQTEGLKFRAAGPRKWLGGEVPFPLNPSFKPPPPLANRIRRDIWDGYMSNPSESRIRSMSQLYGTSILRAKAILRLVGLEEHWSKGKELQYGFLEVMERLLCDEQRQKISFLTQAHPEDSTEADEMSEATKDVARGRYQRLFYEPVVDGEDPSMPTALAKASVDGVKFSKARDDALLAKLPLLTSATKPDVVLERPGRPTLRFVDVGVRFVDVRDQLKRDKASKRRKVLNQRRRNTSAVESTTTSV